MHDICPECMRKEEEEYDKVSKFLRKSPGSSIEDVEKETEVARKKIIKFLKEGKILGTDITSNEPILFCTSCGAPVDSGKLCKKCSDELSKKLSTSQHKTESHLPRKDFTGEKTKGAMHTMDRIMKKREGK